MMRSGQHLNGWIRVGFIAMTVGLMSACASNDKVKMTELVANPATFAVKDAWSSSLGEVAFPLDIKVQGDQFYVAASDGVIAAIDGRTGGDVWRTSTKAQLTAGVGSDGRFAAVVNRNNELISLDGGREIWRHKLSAVTLTAPLVAGERMFVLSGDRSVTAFDAVTGRKLWHQQRPGEALVLKQSGVIVAVGDTLVVGLGGRLAGLNPQTGLVRWEAAVANSRGTNEVERLVDLVSGVSRSGDQVCVRAFQSAIACIDGVRGSSIWNKAASGSSGVGGDADAIFSSESDGTLIAWRRSDGDKLWTSELLKHRSASTPLLVGRAVVVGDGSGYVHFLSRETGLTMNRMSTDGSAVVAGPVLVGQTVVVVTRRGGVFAFRPEFISLK